MTRYEALEAAMRREEGKRDLYPESSVFWLLYDEERNKYETEMRTLTIGEASEEVREAAKE
jgi:hypothetical protein